MPDYTKFLQLCFKKRLFLEMQKIKKLREGMREIKKIKCFYDDALAKLDELTQKEKQDGQH